MRSAFLIGCEGSQQVAYQSDHHNMSLCALVAPQLEFHFVSSQVKLAPLILPHLLPSPLHHNCSICSAICPHAVSTFQIEAFAKCFE